MADHIDPKLRTESLKRKRQLLEHYKRANKDRKKTLGGSAYLSQLEADILSLEPALDLGDPPNAQGATNSAPAPADRDVPCEATHAAPANATVAEPTDPLEKLLNAIPYLALEGFKNAWNDPETQAVNIYVVGPALAETWQALQAAAHKACGALNIEHDHPAWPGPVRNGGLPTLNQIHTTVNWLVERLPAFEVVQAGAPVTSAPQPVYVVYDYDKNEYVELTETMAHAARNNPAAWPGSIERGKELVIRILTNRTKNQKCISCESGGRGQSSSTKGSALRGDGPGFLDKCRCPIDTAILEYWMYKITAEDPQVPPRPDNKKDAEFSLSDFALNPVTLRFIGAAIKEASGLTTENAMFASSAKRVEYTLMWALEQLSSLEQQEHPGRGLWTKLWRSAVKVVKEVDRNERLRE